MISCQHPILQEIQIIIILVTFLINTTETILKVITVLIAHSYVYAYTYVHLIHT